jgi:hypothetical protein
MIMVQIIQLQTMDQVSINFKSSNQIFQYQTISISHLHIKFLKCQFKKFNLMKYRQHLLIIMEIQSHKLFPNQH